jgi:NAD(P)H-dependent FMN reductase
MSLRVVVLVGSVRAGRFGVRIGDWVHKHLAGADVDADLVDLADLSFPSDMSSSADVTAFAARIGRADAVIVVTPEYNHSYPGPLKTAIDALRTEWQAKPVAFVSYGGMSGGLRAVEALRPVFAELHAMTIRETVSLHNPWGPADDPEMDFPDAGCDEALAQLVRVLLWWAEATHDARRRAPYPG